ncbi:hypothetical protein AB6A40_008435 [Gnathostoma spinigerum]|uniref:Uncharacterized protein n=1 Tax=Gnathostoma spinigerum TaxID=75299 RepID=A0ABD6EPG5_9BILA
MILFVYTTLFFLIAVCMISQGGQSGKAQSVRVRGILICDNIPATNVPVDIYNSGKGLDFDELMGSNMTDKEGNFDVTGQTIGIKTVAAKLLVSHGCMNEKADCQRMTSIMIPDIYISVGKITRKLYDVGKIELATNFIAETNDCVP